jgi:hypothetical protein
MGRLSRKSRNSSIFLPKIRLALVVDGRFDLVELVVMTAIDVLSMGILLPKLVVLRLL